MSRPFFPAIFSDDIFVQREYLSMRSAALTQCPGAPMGEEVLNCAVEGCAGGRRRYRALHCERFAPRGPVRPGSRDGQSASRVPGPRRGMGASSITRKHRSMVRSSFEHRRRGAQRFEGGARGKDHRGKRAREDSAQVKHSQAPHGTLVYLPRTFILHSRNHLSASPTRAVWGRAPNCVRLHSLCDYSSGPRSAARRVVAHAKGSVDWPSG